MVRESNTVVIVCNKSEIRDTRSDCLYGIPEVPRLSLDQEQTTVGESRFNGVHLQSIKTQYASVSIFQFLIPNSDRLCGLVVRVLGYRSGGPSSIPGTTKEKISGSGTGSTQLREYN
jgi:hypothetical protein